MTTFIVKCGKLKMTIDASCPLNAVADACNIWEAQGLECTDAFTAKPVKIKSKIPASPMLPDSIVSKLLANMADADYMAAVNKHYANATSICGSGLGEYVGRSRTDTKKFN